MIWGKSIKKNWTQVERYCRKLSGLKHNNEKRSTHFFWKLCMYNSNGKDKNKPICKDHIPYHLKENFLLHESNRSYKFWVYWWSLEPLYRTLFGNEFSNWVPPGVSWFFTRLTAFKTSECLVAKKKNKVKKNLHSQSHNSFHSFSEFSNKATSHKHNIFKLCEVLFL